MFKFKTLFKREVKEVLDESSRLERALELNKEKITLLLTNNKQGILKKELRRLITAKIHHAQYGAYSYANSSASRLDHINSELEDLIGHLWD